MIDKGNFANKNPKNLARLIELGTIINSDLAFSVYKLKPSLRNKVAITQVLGEINYGISAGKKRTTTVVKPSYHKSPKVNLS